MIVRFDRREAEKPHLLFCNFCNRRLSRKLNALVPAAAKLISELWLRIFVIGQGGGALVLGLKALYLLRTCRKCNAQKSFPFLGYYERHRSNFRPELDNIKTNSFGLQHDCNCLYIEHLLCFNIPTYKLIRL